MKTRMNNLMIKLLLGAALMLLSVVLPAQNTPTRMERDMKIFATMLDEYMEKNMGRNNMFNNDTKIEYLEGFGVVVKVAGCSNWATQGQVWIDNKFDKLDKVIAPYTRTNTSTGRVSVRTVTDNDGKKTITTDDNGRVSVKVINKGDKDGVIIEQVDKKEKNKDYKSDYKQTREDQRQAKAELKLAQKNFERQQKHIEKSQRNLERKQNDIEKETNGNAKEMRKEMKQMERDMKQMEKDMKQAEKDMKEAEKEMQEAEKEMQKEMVIYQAQEDSSNRIEDAKSEAAIKDFLVQYADLITELKPNERIRVVYSDSKMNGVEFSWSNDNTTKNKSENQVKGVEVFKSDIDSYKSSKNEKDFKARIRQIAPTKGKESLKVELLSSVFDRVIGETKGESIKNYGKTQVSYLEDYAIKYDTKLMLRNKKYDVDCNCEDDKKPKTTSDDNIKKQQEAMEKVGKEYFLLYGKTVASELKNNEKLIWGMDFGDKPKTENNTDNFFSKMTFSATKSLLDDLDSRKITLEQAMAQVKVEKK